MNQCIGLLYFTIINLMSMSNKIYINGRFLTQKLSGVQRHAFELSKHLSEIDKNHANFVEHENCKLIKHNSSSHLLALQLRDSKDLKEIIKESLKI